MQQKNPVVIHFELVLFFFCIYTTSASSENGNRRFCDTGTFTQIRRRKEENIKIESIVYNASTEGISEEILIRTLFAKEFHTRQRSYSFVKMLRTGKEKINNQETCKY